LIVFSDPSGKWYTFYAVSVQLIEARHWSAVITYRGDRIRLISVRRSRKKEIELYEG
jgi:uncharacterized DUF497 family protein